MRSWRAKVLVLIGVLSIVAAACGGDDNGGETGGAGGTATGGTAGAECNADMQVGMAFDIGGLGDKSFNDAANAGLQQAIADGLVCEENVVTNEANSTGSDRDQNLQALADAGFNLVIGVGFAFSPGVNTIAPDYPDQSFMIVDGFATCGTACGLTNDADAIPNVADYTFKEQEGSFLVGAAAVLKCECKTIGFLGGQTGPGLIEKFQAGYEAGAHQIDPEVEVLVEYIGDAHDGVQRPGQGRAALDQDVRRGRRDHLPRLRCVRGGPVQRGGRGAEGSHRRRLRPVPDGQPRAAAADPDLDAEARRRRRVQLDRGCGQWHVRRESGLRHGGGRGRLRDLEPDRADG